jgi:AraC-like DNA-binding protein/quercetin dioxygenase-like cupin family protein
MATNALTDWTLDRPRFGERAVRRELGGIAVSLIDFPGEGRTPRHSHENAGFTLVLDGRYDKTIGTKRYDCAAGMVTREPPGITHSEIYYANTASLLVEISAARFETMADEARALNEPAVSRARVLVRAAERTRRAFLATDTASALALEAAVLEWAAAMARRAAPRSHRRAAADWLERVRDRLTDDWQVTPSVTELAAEANVHPSHLARAFRARFGASVGEYLRRQRIEWAARALESSGGSLASIAQCAGFCDQSHFTRVFVRVKGLRPGEYRRMHARRWTSDASSSPR